MEGNLLLDNRRRLTLTGFIEVHTIEENKICLSTKLGGLTIKGSNMKINKIDLQSGDVIIIGDIDSLIYKDKKKSCKKENLIKRILK